MDFWEKLEKLTATENKTRIAALAGLPASAISNYLSRRQMPRGDTAFAIAQALKVTLDWLCDDRKGFPPEQAKAGESERELSDAALMHEIARRYRLAVLDFLAELKRLRMIDWQRIADDAERVPPGELLPETVKMAMLAVGSVQVKFSRLQQDFDPRFYSLVHHNELPGRERPLSELEWVMNGHVWGEVEDMPHVARFADALRSRPEWEGSELKQLSDFYHAQAEAFHDAMRQEDAGQPRLGTALEVETTTSSSMSEVLADED